MAEEPGGAEVATELADLTRAELVDLVQQHRERGIRISFSGKENSRNLGRRVRPRISKNIKKYGAGDENERAGNFVIEGDNLQAMTTLYKFRGQVDLILTDPPYNTGNDFRYNDKWEEDPNDSGVGNLVGADDPARHTKWMRFMYPRIQMMKSMLKPGGVLAICIDNRELFRLGQLCDEIFREENRLAIINWEKSYSPRSDNTHVSTATEYVLVYAKDEERAKTSLLPRTATMDARYKSPDGDPRPWKGGDASGPKAKTHKSMVYAIQSPFTGEYHYPPDGKCWRPDQREVKDWLEEWGCQYERVDLNDADERAQVIGLPKSEIPAVKAFALKGSLKAAREAAQRKLESGIWPRLFFGLTGDGRPQLKNHLENVKKGKVVTTWWADDDYSPPLALGDVSWAHEESGHTQAGIEELDAVIGRGHGFETVKPLKLYQKLIHVWCPPDGLVLDPFAGTGTTGHAVMETNSQSEAQRRFALIEQGRPERGDSYAKHLLADRLQRVVSGDWASGHRDALSGGFTFYALDKKVDAQALLKMEREEMTDTVIASHVGDGRRRGAGLTRLPVDQYKYLVAKNSDAEGFFLVWDGPNGDPNFDEDVYELVAEEAEKAELKPPYHVYARLYLFQSQSVIFYQIPDRILRDFGLDLRGEPFTEN